MLLTWVYVLITSGRCYLCVTLLGPCSLLPLAGEQQKLCLCEGEALALSQGPLFAGYAPQLSRVLSFGEH